MAENIYTIRQKKMSTDYTKINKIDQAFENRVSEDLAALSTDYTYTNSLISKNDQINSDGKPIYASIIA